MRNLAGRVALVTGASGGLGRALALELARQGVLVVASGRNLRALELIAEAAEGAAGAPALAVPADLTDPDGRRGLVEQALQRFGRVDILVNNAAVVRAVAFGDEDPRLLYTTNLLAPLALTRLVLPGMLERRSGHVLTIASIAGLVGVSHLANYSASNAALIACTRALRLELAGSGVSTTVVSPGFLRDDGAHLTYATPTPWYLGTTTTAHVARRTIEAVRNDRPELVVTSHPVRPLALLRTASPRLAHALLVRLGLARFTAALAAEHVPYSVRRG